jgi:hypothetical protein
MNQTFVGVDVGTSRLVVARGTGGDPQVTFDINGFIELPDIPAVSSSLEISKLPYVRSGRNLYALGQSCMTFADLFHSEIRRPMANGCLNPNEPSGLLVLSHMLSSMISGGNGNGNSSGGTICYTVPSRSSRSDGYPTRAQLTNHDVRLSEVFAKLGYTARPMKEGEAVVYAELVDTNYTGLAISFGAGLCNVALNYLSVPVLDFSIPVGGDLIDANTASVLNEMASRVRIAKETGFSLVTTEDSDEISRTLRVFYIDLINTVVDSLASVLRDSTDIPRMRQPIQVVLAGGTVLPQGFLAVFETLFRRVDWPFEVAGIRIARDPINAVARGALRYAELNMKAMAASV